MYPSRLPSGASKRRAASAPAARAACLSIGGLYHYFPTKRDLVLHGLCPEALRRHCQDFHAQFGHLAYVDPQRYIAAGLEVVVEHVSFCRPAIHAALELGAESFGEVIETLLTSATLDFEVNLQRLFPEVSDQELHRCGRAIRRSICAALLDKSVTPDELHDELGMLVDGYVNRMSRGGQALTDALVHTTRAAVTPEH